MQIKSTTILAGRRFRTLNTRNFWDRLKELFQLNHLVNGRQIDGYAYETFGEEMDYVRSLATTQPARIITVISGERSQWIANGFHYVNRECYLVLKEGMSLSEFKDFRL